MAYPYHESGLPDAIDRAQGHPEEQSVVFYGNQKFIQGGDLNDLQRIIRERAYRNGQLVAKDGDRIQGGDALVLADDSDPATTCTVQLDAGKIYVAGDIFDCAAATLTDLPLTGAVDIGVVITKTWQTSEDNPDLLGLVAGSPAEGEEGAAREIVTIAWGVYDPADPPDAWASVYKMQDGTILDQTPPPATSGITAQIAVYDRDANGSYIVSGNRVSALGKTGADQVFSIEQGVANIYGYKITRAASLRHAEAEEWDTLAVSAETHTRPSGTTVTVATTHSPIDTVNLLVVVKEVTETVTRGGVVGGADPLAHSSVQSVSLVKQGATTYAATTSYNLVGDSIDWAPGGAEPTTGSTYDVTYRYLDAITPDSVSDTAVTFTGGVAGTNVLIGYTYKLPRIDILCLNSQGVSVYVKGISTSANPLPPETPSNLLKLCEITNNWVTKPDINNNGTRRVTYDDLWRYLRVLDDQVELVALNRLQLNIESKEPTAKRGTFVDPFTDDSYRDGGIAQTAAVGNGVMQLAIAPSFFQLDLDGPVTLDWVKEEIITQTRYTACAKINPYANFNPLPAAMTLSPAADFWQTESTAYASPTTIEFNRGIRTDNGPLAVTTESTQVVGATTELATYLRTISVTAHLKGFGAGENVTTLTFDGINVLPAGTHTADGSGNCDITFTIPANVPVGTKLVYGAGATSKAAAYFTGAGEIDVTILQAVTTIETWERPVVVATTPQGSTAPPRPPIVIADSGGQDGADTSSASYGDNADAWDPQAQSFQPIERRQLVGVAFRLCAIGDQNKHLLVQQVTMENGFPTTNVMAQATVDMHGAAVGWKDAMWALPVTTQPAQQSAFVIATDDDSHAVSIARLGDFDTVTQSYIGSQPYSVGVRFDSSNRITWSPDQNSDLTFKVYAAKYTSPSFTKTVDLGSFDLSTIPGGVSDLQIRAGMELPSSDCSIVFEIEMPDHTIYRVQPDQVLQFASFVTDTVQVRAILKGTEKLSPILYAPAYLVAGTIATSGTYVTRALDLGGTTGITLTSYLKAELPSGSSLSVEYQMDGAGAWASVPVISSTILSDPAWVEQKRSVDGLAGSVYRLRLTLTGSPAARPRAGDLIAATM